MLLPWIATILPWLPAIIFVGAPTALVTLGGVWLLLRVIFRALSLVPIVGPIFFLLSLVV